MLLFVTGEFLGALYPLCEEPSLVLTSEKYHWLCAFFKGITCVKCLTRWLSIYNLNACRSFIDKYSSFMHMFNSKYVYLYLKHDTRQHGYIIIWNKYMSTDSLFHNVEMGIWVNMYIHENQCYKLQWKSKCMYLILQCYKLQKIKIHETCIAMLRT